ncbi:cell division protein ZapE [Idiomarina seosinensis]|uniref:Cell division protein ZapE n=1 Tax=Idiomarina seosinensis TaxID=281739 RepID=A0A432Z4D6_9GAMM|nr:cell division protein ZapE [Idiomarina seosinensis]RUO72754.1 cell division protein ZapE [Idiomarina seosinensis]
MQQSYQQLLEQKQLIHDSQQLKAWEALTALCPKIERQETTKSFYLYGPVGRGKSMLMDLFEQQIATTAKIRLHYHHFMQRVHRQLNELQGLANPMQALADDWAHQYRVICLDEFIVEDIGDAMILATLWSELFARDVVLVTTSNTPPKELYRGGLARHRFEPFIQLIEQQCLIMSLDSGIDYRRLNENGTPYYFINGEQESLRQLANQLFGALDNTESETVMNRQVPCLWKNDKVIGFDFWALCSGPRSQRDYMELAGRYQSLVLLNVPAFTYTTSDQTTQGTEDGYQRQSLPHLSHLDNEARRFIALVDECYDRGCLLIISAATDIEQLYQAELLKFPFQRSISRLIEMQNW